MSEHADTSPVDPNQSRALPDPPETADLVIDAALSDLASSHPDDLGAQLDAGEQVDRTLRARLADLGG